MEGTVFDIQRGSLNDGPGIRTTVFLKGCPLNCLWCHNEESISIRPQLRYFAEKCTHCMDCVNACRPGAHLEKQGKHILDFSRCVQHWDCVEVCPSGALVKTGYQTSVKTILELVKKDLDYYRNSGGGMTVSGGEPMVQHDFTRELLRAAHTAGIHTCLDTTGHTSWDLMEEILKFTDLFLYDFKESDPVKHREYTGTDNKKILENLANLDETGAHIILRCPVIPGLNDREDHFKSIAKLSNSMKSINAVHLLSYHTMGSLKGRQHGICETRKEYPVPTEKQKESWKSVLEAEGCKNLQIF